jgi:hypothetical protein
MGNAVMLNLIARCLTPTQVHEETLVRDHGQHLFILKSAYGGFAPEEERINTPIQPDSEIL